MRWYRLHSPGDWSRRASSRARGHQPSARGRPQWGCLKPPVLGPRASDAGKCPHPGNPLRTAAATRSGRQNGGGSDGLVLRGEPGPRDPASGRAGRPQPPPACVPTLPHPEPRGTPGAPRNGLRPPRRRPLGPRPLSRSPTVPCRLVTSIVKDFDIPGNFSFHLYSEGISESVG